VRPHLATRRVVVVPHGDLHGVPFPALRLDGASLLDEHEVVLAPSAALFLHGLSRSGAPASGCLILGVPDGAAPLIGQEVRRVGEIHPGAQAFVGSAATRAALAAGGRARWVHVASHAAFEAEDPMQSGLLLGDGWLAADEVYDLRLEADVVVLSGCATGRAGVTEGDDLLGLVRGFLHAGAGNLVTSLWRVDDDSTLRFMERLHREIAGGASPAAAIRSAALSHRREFPHPHDWAAFVLTGTGDPLPRSPS
jgi:CHAT domain-containing protein